jgi:Tfp pilus assembly protein PilF
MQRKEPLKARAYVQRYEAAALPLTEDFFKLAIRVETALGDAASAAGYRQRMEQAFPNNDSAPAESSNPSSDQATERTQ